MATDKHFMDDRESLEALVDLLAPEESATYRSYKALSLESGFPGRKMIAYDLLNGVPVNVEVITLGMMRMAAAVGPSIELTSDRRTGVFSVGMVPMKWPDRDLFFHVPQKFELKWKGKVSGKSGELNFAPHYAVLIKSRSKPHLKVDGECYCVRLNQFREMFPSCKVGY